MGVVHLHEAIVTQKGFQVVVHQEGGTFVLPVAKISALVMGYGTSITQAAAITLSTAGVVILWTSGTGVNGFSTAVPVGVRSDLLGKQVKVWSDPELRLAAAKRAYRIRFDDDLNTVQSLEKIRQLEGNRVKQEYKHHAETYGIKWERRNTDWDTSDELNRCITMSYQFLYGYALSVVTLTGALPQLGFVHTGHRLAFVYDIADVLKTNLGLEAAFECFATGQGHRAVGKTINSMMHVNGGLDEMVLSVFQILGEPAQGVVDLTPELSLWSGPDRQNVPAGQDYSIVLDGHEGESELSEVLD